MNGGRRCRPVAKRCSLTASRPFMTGMFTSISTTSNAPLSSASSASSPLPTRSPHGRRAEHPLDHLLIDPIVLRDRDLSRPPARGAIRGRRAGRTSGSPGRHAAPRSRRSTAGASTARHSGIGRLPRADQHRVQRLGVGSALHSASAPWLRPAHGLDQQQGWRCRPPSEQRTASARRRSRRRRPRRRSVRRSRAAVPVADHDHRAGQARSGSGRDRRDRGR